MKKKRIYSKNQKSPYKIYGWQHFRLHLHKAGWNIRIWNFVIRYYNIYVEDKGGSNRTPQYAGISFEYILAANMVLKP